MKKLSIYKGFTLIELLVVIMIIGILASFLMANYVGIRERARDAKRKADLRQLQTAFELYRSADPNGNYPQSLPACSNPLKDSGGIVTYMMNVPCDPSTNSLYTYTYNAPAKSYTLIACLENANDQQSDVGMGKSNANPPCNGSYSYTLTNP
jgi:general secretion pathway protein G